MLLGISHDVCGVLTAFPWTKMCLSFGCCALSSTSGGYPASSLRDARSLWTHALIVKTLTLITLNLWSPACCVFLGTILCTTFPINGQTHTADRPTMFTTHIRLTGKGYAGISAYLAGPNTMLNCYIMNSKRSFLQHDRASRIFQPLVSRRTTQPNFLPSTSLDPVISFPEPSNPVSTPELLPDR